MDGALILTWRTGRLVVDPIAFCNLWLHNAELHATYTRLWFGVRCATIGVDGTDGGEYALLDNHKIGNNILQLRKSHSLTQAELSKRLGVSHQAVSKWEHGECLPDIEILLRLGRIFDQSVEEILLFERDLDDAAAAETPTPLWDKALAEIKNRLSPPSFLTWFSNTRGELVEGVLCIYSPNKFTSDWLSARYEKFILSILKELTDESDLIVDYRIDECNQPRTSSYRQ